MGVTSLWDIVGPAARPVKLEALSRKKLAVDASIWIYQFLKAVRDKDGNKLGQSHIVGFFRRICKLLYFGILPLFVFDGGAPPLKRQVILKRRERRSGNAENAQTTAQKLLAIHLSRAQANDNVYLSDLPVLHPEHKRDQEPPKETGQAGTDNRFIRKDEYHLPELRQFTVSKNDARIMPESEYEHYGEDASFDVVDGVPIDSVDPSSPEFAELPMATQYMILSHLRLRSRLRLGYSKQQLEKLFPNSRDFSRFQIQQVQKRNFYTQQLMTVSGMDKDTGNATRRIAGDKDTRYALVKNEDGWTLSLGEDDTKPVIVDETEEGAAALSDRDSDSEELEDVKLENSDTETDAAAVIESIYDQFKHDYEDTEIPGQTAKLVLQNSMDRIADIDSEVINNQEAMRERLEQVDKQQLQRAIDESKAEYKKLQAEPMPEYDFGRSILWPSHNDDKKDQDEKSVNKENETKEGVNDKRENKENNDTSQVNDIHNKEEDEINEKFSSANVSTDNIDDVNDGSDPQSKKVWDMPSWFDERNTIDNVHSHMFVDASQKDADENEEVGLIPWAEAQKIIESSESDSDLEIVGESWNKKMSENDQVFTEQEKSLNTEKSSNTIPENIEPAHAQAGQEEADRLKKSPHAERQEVAKRSQNVGQEYVPSELKISMVEKNISSPDNIAGGESQGEVAELETSAASKNNRLVYEIDENDEDELIRNLHQEENQHEQLRSELSAKLDTPLNSSITDEQLLQEKLQKAKRDSDEVTETMIRDVQELLKRFGIPYITAPMEAEAQCAELFRMGLVDGIVTDDSDCFLFGGSRIYKNMFNQKQYVECYIAEDIKNKIGLDQDKLIELAMLLGSDYTEGIKGIGPVMAMEILAEFGTLSNFKLWFDRHAKSAERPQQEYTPLEKKLLTRIKNGKLFLPDGFPSSVVRDAYKRPEVDRDDSAFKWGTPSLDQIRSFLMYNVQWSQARVDEVMVPLIRDMNRKKAEGTQSTIGEFFPEEYISYKKNVGLGKRMKVAASKLSK
ncbi:putative DNA repair protein [Clavispora lusitaniae]|uniref:DNA repair protein n=1 Tax=Clavispora lusitaniae TaxID=36911 RepID=A0ACD0WHF4_CLALS|nr:putative DNA repair protein [Clavispora lusitaniae]QFZ32392.1 putative DNA repair protein [Clavispora lusitaniae]QFZ38061.1 putative DNA repair protein [Clavispora lusitaniae]QFZ43744.1 putative DNA repair protein [Clavispora lusitaniae]QFZ49421.1 putative DNA repair protein [Clavispora lusitaniae]